MTESASLAPPLLVAGGQPASAWQRPPLWRRLVLPIAAARRRRGHGWHRRLAHDAPERALASRVLPSPPTGAASVGGGHAESRPHDHAGRYTDRLQGEDRDALARSSSCTHWTSSSRRRSRDSGTPRGAVFLAGRAMDRLRRAGAPSRSRKSPSPADRPSSSAASIAQVGAPPGVTTTASSLRRPAVNRPPARVGGRRRADGPDDTKSRTRGSRSSLAPVPAGQPGRAVYDHPDRRAASMLRKWRCSTCRPARRRS